jgi:Tol biopolymer transport system component
MKKLFLLFSMAIIAFGCKTDQKKSVDIAKNLKQYSIEQMMDNESVFGGSFSTDKSKLLVTSNRSGIYNVYAVSTSDGTFTPISTSDSTSVWATSYFPNDDRILFNMDNNGDEIDHLFVKNIDGTTKDLTPDKGAKAGFYGWSKDQKSFFFASNKRDKSFMDVYEM